MLVALLGFDIQLYETMHQQKYSNCWKTTLS